MYSDRLMPKRRTDVTIRDVNGEILILDRRIEQVHQLNSTASYVWLRCDGSASIADVVASMAHEYGMRTEDVEKDITIIIEQFRLSQLFE